jgi:hypothetical protein
MNESGCLLITSARGRAGLYRHTLPMGGTPMLLSGAAETRDPAPFCNRYKPDRRITVTGFGEFIERPGEFLCCRPQYGIDRLR